MVNNRVRSKRNLLFRACVLLTILIALFSCQINLPSPEAQAQIIGIEFIFDVVPNEPTLRNSLPLTGTPFYLEGKIYPFRSVNMATCEFNVATPRVVGTWRAWGQVADDGRLVVNQSMLVSSSGGTIELQGVTGVTLGTQPASPAIPGQRTGPTTGPTEVLSVTGGAGVYRALNGEGQVRSYCSDPTRPFRYDRPFCIQIIEGKRR
ncbi:MAG TPA: hypothetical protein VKA70_12655 [Blastocatellia bacterium]|nr:hypothetical protein [Blastocatellia bacterium]